MSSARHRVHLAAHLVRRFFGRFRHRPLEEAELRWVTQRLTRPERALWLRQSPADQRHSLTAAQLVTVETEPGAVPPAWVSAAALLHDIGKIEADLGVAGRVAAALLGAVGVRRAPGRLGRHLRYPELGADLLRAAGSDALVVAWAAEHHLEPTRWTVPLHWAAALLIADDAAV
ncbi:MAG: HD domain-containing protein [Acidimicrobiales bacterium]